MLYIKVNILLLGTYQSWNSFQILFYFTYLFFFARSNYSVGYFPQASVNRKNNRDNTFLSLNKFEERALKRIYFHKVSKRDL